jgi:hypothetical protein
VRRRHVRADGAYATPRALAQLAASRAAQPIRRTGECTPSYAGWVALLEMRQAVLVHAELHMRHRHAHGRRRMPAPTLYH